MEHIELGKTYTISNISTSWIGIIEVINNIANVKLGNSEIIMNVPISSDNITESIKTYLNIQ